VESSARDSCPPHCDGCAVCQPGPAGLGYLAVLVIFLFACGVVRATVGHFGF